MGNDKLTKAVVLGWYEGLKWRRKRIQKKRKIVLLWRRVLIEAGVEPMEVDRKTRERTEWKELVKERVEHIDLRISQKENGY